MVVLGLHGAMVAQGYDDCEGDLMHDVRAIVVFLDGVWNNRAYLGYAKALRRGFPIATGVIEGACRYLVKDRMDRTGARWSLAGAEAVLRLRALVTNGDFDEYWGFHLQRERERNHLSRYPEIVESAAVQHEPHQLAHYLRELANDLHTYYNAHQFLVADEALRNARLNLIAATRQVLANGLGLLGVSAPDSM